MSADARHVPRSGTPVSSPAMGMALFVLVEAMIFAGFISAFVVVRSSALPGAWPPLDQPRLPVGQTALNTAALLASGVALWITARLFRRASTRWAGRSMAAVLVLGTLFVLAQGIEWVRLIGQGLTLTSSQLGSFFYLIIGAHALHAACGIAALTATWWALRAGRLTASWLGAVQVFWYFVVLVWPLLYWKVYL